MEDEMREYERRPTIVSREFNFLGWWCKVATTPKLGANSNILVQAKFPLLASMANIFHSVNSTNCRSERDFSALELTLSNLRQSLLPEKMRQMMFLRVNPVLLPDVAATNDRLA